MLKKVAASGNGGYAKSTAGKKDALAGIGSELNLTSMNKKCMFLLKNIKTTNAFSGTRLTS